MSLMPVMDWTGRLHIPIGEPIPAVRFVFKVLACRNSYALKAADLRSIPDRNHSDGNGQRSRLGLLAGGFFSIVDRIGQLSCLKIGESGTERQTGHVTIETERNCRFEPMSPLTRRRFLGSYVGLNHSA